MKRARTPRELLSIPTEEVERIIYPVGFYKVKSRLIKEISRTVIEKYHNVVPDTLDELLTIKGVGRKTANIVITEGFGAPGIAVDTHVHRISNRLGAVRTKTPRRRRCACGKSSRRSTGGFITHSWSPMGEGRARPCRRGAGDAGFMTSARGSASQGRGEREAGGQRPGGLARCRALLAL